MARHLARLVATVAVVGLTWVTSARAGSTPPSELYLDWASGWSRSVAEAGDFLRIALDPETGQWGPAPVERALATSGLMAPPLVLHRADGSIEVILDARIVDYMVARLGPDGRPIFDCVPADRLGPTLSSSPAADGPPDR